VSLVSTRGLSKHYSGLRAVHNVDFDLPEGQVRALIGPNGAGKTTFVGMLSGRIKSTAGSVRFKDTDVTGLPAHKRMSMGMAYTFQITSVFANLSVHENVALAARRVINDRPSVVNDKVQSVLEQVYLSDRTDQIAGDLSYGHQRLLEIGMGLAQSPSLFILDEPTQGLSATEVDGFIELVKELSKKTTILLIEHNMDVVMRTAHYITVLNFGETLAEGTPDEIRNNADVQTAYLGSQ